MLDIPGIVMIDAGAFKLRVAVVQRLYSISSMTRSDHEQWQDRLGSIYISTELPCLSVYDNIIEALSPTSSPLVGTSNSLLQLFVDVFPTPTSPAHAAHMGDHQMLPKPRMMLWLPLQDLRRV